MYFRATWCNRKSRVIHEQLELCKLEPLTIDGVPRTYSECVEALNYGTAHLFSALHRLGFANRMVAIMDASLLRDLSCAIFNGVTDDQNFADIIAQKTREPSQEEPATLFVDEFTNAILDRDTYLHFIFPFQYCDQYFREGLKVPHSYLIKDLIEFIRFVRENVSLTATSNPAPTPPFTTFANHMIEFWTRIFGATSFVLFKLTVRQIYKYSSLIDFMIARSWLRPSHYLRTVIATSEDCPEWMLFGNIYMYAVPRIISEPSSYVELVLQKPKLESAIFSGRWTNCGHPIFVPPIVWLGYLGARSILHLRPYRRNIWCSSEGKESKFFFFNIPDRESDGWDVCCFRIYLNFFIIENIPHLSIDNAQSWVSEKDPWNIGVGDS